MSRNFIHTIKKGEYRKKGQMFIINTCILIITLLMLVVGTSYTQPKTQKAVIEHMLYGRIFENIKEEMKRVPIYTFYTQRDENILDFLSFIRNYTNSRGLIFEGIYLGILYNTSDKIYVTFINSYGKELNVSLILNSTPTQEKNFIVSDSSIHQEELNVVISKNYILTIIFNGYQENINISIEENKRYYLYFFDIWLIQEENVRREKYINIFSL